MTVGGASERQVSGTGAGGELLLSVLAKRAYRWDGTALVEPQDVPLVEEHVVSPEEPEILLADTDLYGFKPFTDVVVVGTAYPSQSCSSFEAGVRVEGIEKRVLVLGDRRVLQSGAFTEPDSVEPIPLSYADAFGGADELYFQRAGHPLEALRSHFDDPSAELTENPYAYPRNPCGTGFLMVDRKHDEETCDRLPRFEDPDDRLTPERRACGASFDWVRQPMPAGLGWFGLMWFPRVAHFGLVPEASTYESAREVSLGLVDASLLSDGARLAPRGPRCTCGASPGLSVPYLRGGESISLKGLSAHAPRVEVQLPTPPTRMQVDGRKGKMLDVQPVLSTVVIEPDAARVTVVWRGSARALRPYSADELSRMPFEVVW